MHGTPDCLYHHLGITFSQFHLELSRPVSLCKGSGKLNGLHLSIPLAKGGFEKSCEKDFLRAPPYASVTDGWTRRDFLFVSAFKKFSLLISGFYFLSMNLGELVGTLIRELQKNHSDLDSGTERSKWL